MKEILQFVPMRMDLEDHYAWLKKKKSQTQKDKYCMIPLIWLSKVVKFVEWKSRMVVARGCGEEKTGSYS